MKRIAFVGAGRVADVHFDALKSENTRARLTAVSDIRENAVQNRIKEWNVNGYLSYKEMIEKEKPDAVYILLPHHLHLEAVEFAMKRDIPVFLEKPIASDLDHALKIERIARKSPVPLFVGHNGLFHPAFREVKELVKSGKIGKPLFAKGKKYCPGKSRLWLHPCQR
jgi:predicted dehydrogenase